MPNNKIVLGFVGDLASGKGTICKYLLEKYGTNSYRFSTMLRDVLKRLYVENSRENLQNLSTVLRTNFGQDLMSRVIAEDVKNDSKEIVAVEGIRRPTDITYLEKNPGFNLIYITADPQTRWERLVKRNENPGDDKKTFEEFTKDEGAEADRMIKELGKTAKFTITNNGNFEEFYNQMETILKSIHEGKH
ncbi:MAG: AAA family ATPase [Patescibacteria group bacterium]|jgi:dephospho-CoA kinase